jgi:hypothetical protein
LSDALVGLLGLDPLFKLLMHHLLGLGVQGEEVVQVLWLFKDDIPFERLLLFSSLVSSLDAVLLAL